MSIRTQPERLPAEQTNSDSWQPPQPRPLPKRSSPARRLLVSALIVAAIIAGGLWLVYQTGLLGGVREVTESTYTARKQNFLVTVIEDGNLESASNVDVKCQVAGGSSIISIVEDGSFVEEGQQIIELESSELVDQINQQKNTYEKAKAVKIQAEKDHVVAKISVKEFLEGTFEQDLQIADTAITVAEENLRSAKNAFEFTRKMFRKGYISKLELESQQFNVERAELKLESARTARNVLVNFTKSKVLEELSSAVETTRANMESENAAFELEKSRLERLEAQLANCIIFAPQSGMVVYANIRGHRGSQEEQIKEGAAVREQQTIIRLPDLSQMQVKVLVHESKIEQVRPEQPATIRILDKVYDGHVLTVANQPEPTSFFSAGTKEYSAIVRIDDKAKKLKPGMTCETEILIIRVKDAVAIPIASVVKITGKHYCWVKKDKKYQQREVTIGWSNEEVVEIKNGIDAGEVVIKNPKRFADKAREKAEANAGPSQKFAPRKNRDSDSIPAPNDGSPPGPTQPAAGPADSAPPSSAAMSSGESLLDNDKDGDGKVSQSEAPAFMKSFFGKLDANSDGFVDAQEIKAARSRPDAASAGPPQS